MGTEKDLTAILMGQITERRGISPAGLRRTGGTPNHKALARCVGYGWALATPEDRDEGRGRVLEFLRDQKAGHMAFGRISEFGTASHFAWWQNALAGIWTLAEREGDQEVLEGVRGWWVRELSVESLCSTPAGKVVIPGARAHVVKGYADQRAQRDVGRAILLGDAAGVRIPRVPRDVRAGNPSLDRVGLWLLHSQLPAAELRKVATAPPEWPVPLDTLYVRRSEAGHVAWFDRFTGLCPSYFAWAEYSTGTSTGAERYGARGDWKKDHPGGPRPAELAVPKVPGEVRETVVIQGRDFADDSKELTFRGHEGSGAFERRSGMNKKDTNAKGTEDGGLVIHDAEEPLKSERVEEALRAMPGWELALEGQAITLAKELPTAAVASLYTAYVTGFAGSLGQPVAVGISDGLVLVSLYAQGSGNPVGGLTESVLDFARQIG